MKDQLLDIEEFDKSKAPTHVLEEDHFDNVSQDENAMALQSLGHQLATNVSPMVSAEPLAPRGLHEDTHHIIQPFE